MLVTCVQKADFPRRNKANGKQTDQDFFCECFQTYCQHLHWGTAKFNEFRIKASACINSSMF